MHLYAHFILFSLFHCPLLFPSMRNPLPYSSLIILPCRPGVPLLKTNYYFYCLWYFFLGVLLQAKELCYISHNFSQKYFTLTSLGHHNTKNSFNKKDTDNFGFTRLTKSIWEHITIFYKSWLNEIDWGFVIIFAYNFTSMWPFGLRVFSRPRFFFIFFFFLRVNSNLTWVTVYALFSTVHILFNTVHALFTY